MAEVVWQDVFVGLSLISFLSCLVLKMAEVAWVDVFVGLGLVSFLISTAIIFVQSCHISLHPLFIGTCEWHWICAVMMRILAAAIPIIIPLLTILAVIHGLDTTTDLAEPEQSHRNRQFDRIRQTKRLHLRLRLARPSTT